MRFPSGNPDPAHDHCRPPTALPSLGPILYSFHHPSAYADAWPFLHTSFPRSAVLRAGLADSVSEPVLRQGQRRRMRSRNSSHPLIRREGMWTLTVWQDCFERWRVWIWWREEVMM